MWCVMLDVWCSRLGCFVRSWLYEFREDQKHPIWVIYDLLNDIPKLIPGGSRMYTISCKASYRQKCQLSSTLFHHWRQTKHLEQSYRAGVWRLSHRLCPCREESPAQRKVGEALYRTSLDQLFVQQKCTVIDKMAGNNLQLQLSSLQGSSTLHGPPDWESRNWWVHKFI